MIPGLGREQITLGSAPGNDVVLQGPGVGPQHARIVKQNGQLFYVDQAQGPSFANGAPVAPQQPVPFDFRTQFTAGQGVPVPLSHPAIVSMLMSPGQVQAPRGQVIVGREPSRASLAIGHGAVSGQHATVMLDRMMVMDHGSTSGTYVGGQRIAPNQPVPIDPNGVIAFGPVPIPVSLLAQLAQGAAVLGHAAPLQPAVVAGHGPPPGDARAPMGSPPLAPAGAAPAHEASGPQAAPRKHRTVIGELDMSQLQGAVISIGRTPDNKIVVPHPQVSSRHAQIVTQGGQIFLEDLRSANGTFVRGQRIAPGQRVPVQNGERVFIGPMPVVIQIAGQHVGVVVEDQQASWAGKPLYEIEGWDLYLEVPDRDQKGQMKVLLDRVSFKALPGDMIALMGPSPARARPRC
jgi:pSer/pThr/pTyr-binding forkhead associated (FHA) protein